MYLILLHSISLYNSKQYNVVAAIVRGKIEKKHIDLATYVDSHFTNITNGNQVNLSIFLWLID